VTFHETTTGTKHFDEAIEIYTNSFPESARQPLSVIRKRVASRKERLLIGVSDNKVVAFALLWRLKGSGFVLLDYLAVKKELRSRSIGFKFMRFISSSLRSSGEKLIIEVDDPRFGRNKQEKERRVLFYKRCGSRVLNGIRYFLGSMTGTRAHRLILMIMPARSGCSLKGESVRKLVMQIYKELYHRDSRDEVVQATLATIPKTVSID
jgi:ribosomal protein S18 acetylase RimI-like enzyme